MDNFEVEYGKRIVIPFIFKKAADGTFVNPSGFNITVMRLENAPDFYTIIAGVDYNSISWGSDTGLFFDEYHYDTGKYGIGFPKKDLDFRIFGSYLIIITTDDPDVAEEYKHQEIFVNYKERRGLTFSFPDYTASLVGDTSDLGGLLSIGESIYTSSIYTNYKSRDIYLGASAYPTSIDASVKFINHSDTFKLHVIGVEFYVDGSITNSNFYICDEDGNIITSVEAGELGAYTNISSGYDVYYDSVEDVLHYLQFYTDTGDLTTVHTVVYYDMREV